MNNNSNNNRNNNRRRGRGNRQQGGGNQNRIDSRARGNAPQMLDKYRKLAQDAQHNGDRVQAEYYLQFADHYFRVIADSRPRQEEQRARRDERDFSNEEEGDEDEFDSPRTAREDRQRDDRPREDRQRDDRQRDDRPRGDRGRNDRQRQPNREEGERVSEGEAANEYEPAENPFVRPSRERNNRRTRGGRGNEGETADMTSDVGEIDASALPPSFSAGIAANSDDDAEPVTRKLPPRRRRKPADEAGEGEGDNLTAVG
ncbi:DUF4167 domain-containing protein [Tsuneonella rigui]|uniref:DUF4167 domain-containing protein n=1 Tax=Tsuneonella rigui TaxID=1708790 RepID=UPI000F7F6A2E|nr:DUF4167 domain-containing protein [Tsuneonella rigui]